MKQKNFGQYIKEKRVQQGYSLRTLAYDLGVSAAYLNDIEKSHRLPPEKYLYALMKTLLISNEETDYFFDLAGFERKSFYDINEYLINHQAARTAIRRARDLNITDEEWQEFIKERFKKE